MSLKPELEHWVKAQLASLNMSMATFSPIVGDAGFREYFRLGTKPALLAVYGPPATENHAAFVRISEHWRRCGINAPRVYAHDCEQGFLLIEDFGVQSLADLLAAGKNLEDINRSYAPVIAQLLQLQQMAISPDYAVYDNARLRQEFDVCGPWFIEQLLGHPITPEEQQLLATSCDFLLERINKQPRVIVHRDFHSRNIQITADAGVGLIDFQDAVVGPVTYDLVSLLKDCYQQWPASYVSQATIAYRQQLPAHLAMASDAEFLEAFNLMGLQRHFKVLGVFARLYLRDGKARYLNDLPLVMAYVQEALLHYPQLAPLAEWFNSMILPLAKQQSWYRSVEIQP